MLSGTRKEVGSSSCSSLLRKSVCMCPVLHWPALVCPATSQAQTKLHPCNTRRSPEPLFPSSLNDSSWSRTAECMPRPCLPLGFQIWWRVQIPCRVSREL